jgi:WD40 repeat protein
LASASFEGPIRLWDLESGKEKRTLNGNIPFSCVAFSPDGKLVAAGGGEGTIKLWNGATGREWTSLTHGDDWVYSVAFSPDGKTLAVGTENDEVLLWDVVAAKFIGALQGHLETVRPVAFSPDGKTLASGGDDDLVKLWDMTQCRAGTFSQYEKSNPNVWYRNNPQSIAHAKLVHDFAGHVATVTGVAFSPDGTILASSSLDSTVILWDVASLRIKQDKKAPALGADAISACWNELAGVNAAKAYEAIWTLASVPGQAVPFIRDYLQPAPQPDHQRMARLVVELDNSDFSVRRNAAEELEKLQDLAGPFLRRQLTKQISLEARRRVEQLLEKIDGPVRAPEQLRALRAIEVLEHIATSEAREVLQILAKGAPEARLTQEAKASLERLDKRAGAKP